MEYVISVFVGVWIAAAGVFAYIRICKDFKDIDKKKDEGQDGK